MYRISLNNETLDERFNTIEEVKKYLDTINGYDIIIEKYEIFNTIEQLEQKEQELDLLKSIVKLDHPEIAEVKHFESGLTVILDKCVESKEKENQELKEQLAIRDKSLEFACDVIRQYVKIVFNDDVDRLKGVNGLENYYLQKAKEYIIYREQAKENMK